ncbi:MAG: hypothetical protein AAGG46_10805, partial [Planctomycetota bacterium]
GSAAGAPLSQTKGADAERAAVDGAGRDRKADEAKQAERNSGIGQTEEDQETSDRDADGRRLWERPNESTDEDRSPSDPSGAVKTDKADKPIVKDPTGVAGRQLDLLG